MAKQRQAADRGNGLPVQSDDFVSSGGFRGQGLNFLKRYSMRSLEVFLYWMPVWVPLILLAQVGTLGLRASRSEEQRLIGHETELNQRYESDAQENQDLKRQLQALDSPIYLERLRRQRVDQQQAEIESRGLAPTLPGENRLPPVSETQ
ncbi:MAG: hypothetical protein ACI89E_002210 [Planctomycetota bacterium]